MRGASDHHLRIAGPQHPSRTSRFGYIAGLVITLVLGVFVNNTLVSRLGTEIFLYALIGITFALVYGYMSFRDLSVPFYVMILAIGLLRFVWSIKAPVLPDLYFDRISMIWLTIVFMIVVVAQGRGLRRPWTLDLFILAHGLYILVRIMVQDFYGFHTWTMSIMTPYVVYFYAKNTIQTKRQIDILMAVLLLLVVYYSITSIAEKYHIAQLLYPEYMIVPHPEFIGRSTGPFRNSGIFGNAIGMLLPVHLYFVARTSKTYLKVLLLFSMAVGLAGLFFTYTRGSWLSGGVAILVTVFLNPRQYLRPFVPMIVVTPLLALFVLGMGQDQFMKERAENDDTIGARVGTAITAFRVWRDNPLFGCGSFRYTQVRENYIEPISVPGLGTIRFVQYRKNSIHDMYLGPMAEDGLVGSLMVYAIYFMIFKTLWARFKMRARGDPFALYIIPIFTGITMSYLVGGLTISYRNTSILGVLLFMAAGIASGYRADEGTGIVSSGSEPRGRW